LASKRATLLSVNLNAVAMLRNRRELPWPSVTGLGKIALQSGASGLTIHPRPDERHIRRSDVADIRALIDDEFQNAELNIEGYPSDEFLDLVEQHQPNQVTLVPDDPDQATSDHGWDFRGQGNFLRSVVQRLKNSNMRVALFCDPDSNDSDIRAAGATGADRIEIYTGPYAAMYDNPEGAKVEAGKIAQTAALAQEAGLGINAGHDLTVANLPLLVNRVKHIDEVSIGHGLTADALEFGMKATIERFLIAIAG